MSSISSNRLFAAVDATWPAVRIETIGPFNVRQGGGGGNRVSAGTLAQLGQNATLGEVEVASAVMTSYAQLPQFMIRDGEDKLDSMLENLGFELMAPTVAYEAEIAELEQFFPTGLTCITCDAPLAIQKEIWKTDGIGPARIDVMNRVKGAKSFLLGRLDGLAAGTGFVACDREIAMIHALVVNPKARRSGIGKALTGGAAKWARQQGATQLTLLTTKENTAARTLYQSIGMRISATYHYRILRQ